MARQNYYYLCVLALLVVSGTTFSSCQKELEPIGESVSFSSNHNPASTPNVFSSRAAFEAAMKSEPSGLRSLNVYDNGDNLELEELVPNDNFRRLLTPKGEIIVNDTLYRISPEGTYFTPVDNADELNRIIERKGYLEMRKTSQNLYILNGVSLIKTFGDEVQSSETSENFNEDNSIAKNLRASNQELDINRFPVKNVDRVTIVGKLIQSLFGTKKDGEENLKNARDLRISGSLYSYDYKVYREMGMRAQVEKKVWRGWSKMKNWSDGTTIGYNGLIVREEIKNLNTIWRDYKFATWKDLTMIGDYRGLSLDIVAQNFLLNDEDKFAFYAFQSNSEPSYDQIQKIANDLSDSSQVMSFATLQHVHGTPFVGFIIDVPEENARYIYMKGTQRWRTGSRQVKIFDSDQIEINFGELSQGYKKVSESVSAIVEKIKQSKNSGNNPQVFDNHSWDRNRMMHPQNFHEYQSMIEKANIKIYGNNSKLKDLDSEDLIKKIAQGVSGVVQIARSFKFPKKSKYKISGEAYCHTRYAGEYTGLIMHKQKFD